MSTLEFDASVLTDEEIRRMLTRLEIPFQWSTSVHVAPRYAAVCAIMDAAQKAYDRYTAARSSYLHSDIVTQELMDEFLASEVEWKKFTKRA